MSEAFFCHLLHAEPRELADKLRQAYAVTSELMNDIIHEACLRLPSVRRTKNFDRLQWLIQSGAWTDAALVLLELELPQWQIRRIAYDEAEWHCALSRQRELPDWLDQSIEACHADLSLAILSALVEVRRIRNVPFGASPRSTPRSDDAFCVRLCCDNFA